MALNPYFSNYNGEQNLVEDITIEVIKATGINCVYVPREYLSIDKIFGEDPGTKFKDSYPIEMYLESYKGFQGTDVISQFGLEIRDKVLLVLSRKRFKEEVTNKNATIIRPREGDLIYFPLSKSLFEINFVEHENPLYPLGKLYSYAITAELFTYSYEKMATSNAAINEVYNKTRGNATIDIIPNNSMLGTTAGINDVLQDESEDYGFDPNDPNASCASDGPQGDHTLVALTWFQPLEYGGGPTYSNPYIARAYLAPQYVFPNPNPTPPGVASEGIPTTNEVVDWFAGHTSESGIKAIIPQFIHNAWFALGMAYSYGISQQNAYHPNDAVRDSSGNIVQAARSIVPATNDPTDQSSSIYAGTQTFASPWLDGATDRIKPIWQTWLTDVKNAGITFQYFMGNIADSTVPSPVNYFGGLSRRDGNSGAGYTLHYGYVINDVRTNSGVCGNAATYGSLYTQLRLDQGVTLDPDFNSLQLYDGQTAGYLLWNFVMGRLASYYINKGFYEPVQTVSPGSQVSNYSNYKILQTDYVTDYNGHKQYLDNAVGNAKAPTCYGEMIGAASVYKINQSIPTRLSYDPTVAGVTRFGYDSNGNVSAWRAFQLDQQKIRATVRNKLSTEKLHPWIKSRIDTTNGAMGGAGAAKRNEYWKENILHTCMFNPEALFYFNQYTQDNLVADILLEVNTLKDHKRATPLSQNTTQFAFTSNYLATGCRIYTGQNLWRITTNYDKVNTIVVNGTSYNVSTIPGIWYTTESSITGFSETSYNASTKTLYIA